MKTVDSALAGLVQSSVENARIRFLAEFLTTYSSKGEKMDQVDDLTKNVLVDIINNLEVQPRAQIVKLYYLEHRSENAIALQLNLPKTVVQNHIQLFKVLLANTLEEEPSQFQRSSCYLC